jgi:UDP-glucose 4-epimerase
LPFRFFITRIPFIGKFFDRNTFVGDPTTRAWLIPVHEEITMLDSIYLPLDILKPLIEQSVYRAIPPFCLCREAFNCESFPHDLACLTLGAVAIDAEKFGMKNITIEDAISHVEKAVSVGLAPMIVWERGNQTLFGLEENKGLAVCFCCNCCCDYRMGLRLGNKDFRKKVFRPEGVSVVVSDECVSCGECSKPEVCSISAITQGEEKAHINLDLCVGCGACIAVCPEKAISFVFDPETDIVGKLLAKIGEHTSVF